MNAMLTESEAEKVKDLIMEQLNVLREQITPEANIEADLGADSLDKVSIAMAVEEQFGVSIPDDRTERLQTYGDLCEELALLLGRGR